MYQIRLRAGRALGIAYSYCGIPFNVTRQNSFGFVGGCFVWGGWIGPSVESKRYDLAAGGVLQRPIEAKLPEAKAGGGRSMGRSIYSHNYSFHSAAGCSGSRGVHGIFQYEQM